MHTSAARRIRPVRIAHSDAIVRHGDAGVIYMESPRRLGEYARRITDSLDRWAVDAPDRVFLAQRTADGSWARLTYADARRRARSVAQSLLDWQLGPDRPVLILSGNGIDHGVLALAAMYVGVPYAPIAPPYSLQSKDFATLKQIAVRMRPGLVFADDASAFGAALAQVDAPAVTRLADLETAETPAVDAARDLVGPDTVAKILFTSGSTGRPKGVLNTQRMLCSNQAMISAVLEFLGDEPPVLCDWSPWNHTAGGNHNFGLVLTNGGTLYIDDGKPTPALFERTLRNLREVACTAHFAIPRTYELLMPHLRADAALRDTFFSRLKLLFYAAAGLGQKFWDELREVSIEATGEEILIMTGFGATETAPFAICTGSGGAFAGMIGLPAPGMQLKLVPVGTKLEARVRGPNITPGYFGDPELTRAAFDDEGYYQLGDAMRFVDPADPGKGLIFDGRLAEDFKLSTGTWVSVGPLRTKFLQQAAGLAQDVVITGHDRSTVGALVFPNLVACRQLAGLPESAPPLRVVTDPRVVEHFRRVVEELAARSTGSSTFVARAMLMDEAPSLDAREITDKNSINQKAVLAHRAALVEELYAPAPSARIITS